MSIVVESLEGSKLRQVSISKAFQWGGVSEIEARLGYFFPNAFEKVLSEFFFSSVTFSYSKMLLKKKKKNKNLKKIVFESKKFSEAGYFF